MRFGINFFRKWGNIRSLQQNDMSNETVSQEKQFKHIFWGRVSGKSPKIGLKLKNISGSGILIKKVCMPQIRWYEKLTFAFC